MNRFCTSCSSCGATTSRAYARAHNGQCKGCVTGEETLYRCHDCGEKRLTAYQKRNRYHCDSCTRETDPCGWANEVMGYTHF